MNELSEFVGASVTKELKELLEQAARDSDLSMAQIIRRALTAYFDSLGVEKDKPNA